MEAFQTAWGLFQCGATVGGDAAGADLIPPELNENRPTLVGRFPINLLVQS
jgi:hypothetical protein